MNDHLIVFHDILDGALSALRNILLNRYQVPVYKGHCSSEKSRDFHIFQLEVVGLKSSLALETTILAKMLYLK